jgi:hypothetical protein
MASGLGPGFFNLDNLMMPQNVALMVVSWALTELVSRATRSSPFVKQHVLPLLPVAFCELFVFLTANWQPEATVGERALLGALLGTVTVWGHVAAGKAGLQKFLPFGQPAEDAPAPELREGPGAEEGREFRARAAPVMEDPPDETEHTPVEKHPMDVTDTMLDQPPVQSKKTRG